jgi:hypothetical protein
MKRSQINRWLAEAEAFFAAGGFALPPWAHWEPAAWAALGPEGDEIAADGLGWDVTDFGSGDYDHCGLLLFTLRNGGRGAKPYAEKAMMVKPGQVTPTHFHHRKTEDIIVRGGGRLVVQLWPAAPDESLGEGPLAVFTDGVRRDLAAGAQVVLAAGESITLTPRLYHAFWGHPDDGPVLVGEVSAVNDDVGDNRFLQAGGRFPAVEEDEPARRLLCTEYDRWRAR